MTTRLSSPFCLSLHVSAGRGLFVLLPSVVLCLGSMGRAAAQPSGWVEMPCPAADRNLLDRFAVVERIADFDAGCEGWKPHAGGQQAYSVLQQDRTVRHEGEASMRVEFAFSGEKQLEYVAFGNDAPVVEKGLGLGFWVKGDGTPLSLKVRIVDSSGECHQVPLERLPAGTWAFVAAAFSDPGGWWGGDGNGKLDYPCRVDSIVADRPHRGFKGSGAFWLDEVALVRPRLIAEKLRIEASGVPFGNVYEPGQEVRLRAAAPGNEIRWEFRDYWEAIVGLGKGVGDENVEIRVALPREGFYSCRVERVENGHCAEARVFRCAALRSRAAGPPNDYIGVCSHFRSNAYPLECMALMKRYGIDQFRDEISWSSFEQQKGHYSMPAYGTAFVVRADQLGMSPLLIFDYANRFYDDGGFPNSEEALSGYATYCAELSRSVAGQVTQFEIWNEWSGGCGMRGKPGEHTPSAYAAMATRAYAAVKAVAPDVTIVGIGGEHSEHHLENIREMMTGGAARAMDAFSVHSYRYPRGPEESDLAGEIIKVAVMAESVGAPKRVWVTEIGWPTHIQARGVDERVQARYAVRALALLQSTGVVEKVHWYDFKNDGLNRAYNEDNFGIVWHQTFNCAPKPAVVSMAVFARATAGADVGQLWHRGELYAAAYSRSDGTDLHVAWSSGMPGTVQVEGAVSSIRDTMGNAQDTSTSVVLTQDPIYITGQALKIRAQE